MSIHNFPTLAPMVAKLARGVKLGSAECEALSGLPYRLASRDPGAYLVREGDTSADCLALLSGFACRSKITEAGARPILSIHLRGDLVDLQNSLLDQADHSVQALTPVVIAYIPARAIMDVAEAHPSIARALWRDTLVDGSVFREWILNVGRRDARQRISHLLCELALRQEAAGICEGPNYEWPMTQEQLGDATGLTSVHVNRTLQRMRHDGLISTSKHILTVEDWPRLKAAADFRSAYLHQGVSLAA